MIADYFDWQIIDFKFQVINHFKIVRKVVNQLGVLLDGMNVLRTPFLWFVKCIRESCDQPNFRQLSNFSTNWHTFSRWLLVSKFLGAFWLNLDIDHWTLSMGNNVIGLSWLSRHSHYLVIPVIFTQNNVYIFFSLQLFQLWVHFWIDSKSSI